MKEEIRQTALSAVERNLDSIGKRRQRLRGARPEPAEANDVANETGPSATMDLATVSARATLRMAGVLDDFSSAVVGDITRAGKQVARLHQQATCPVAPAAPRNSQPASSRIRPDVTDVDVIEVNPNPVA